MDTRILEEHDVRELILFQFPPAWGLPNASVYCMRLETFLRIHELPYEVKYVRNPARAPKGKLPFVKLDGEILADSEMIMSRLLTTIANPVDDKFDKETLALGTLVEQVLCERLYWLMLYTRWQHETGWQNTKTLFFKNLPWWIKWYVPHKVRKKMLQSLYAQGMGRHSSEEVMGMLRRTFDALSIRLGDKPYCLGQYVSSVDATLFTFLINFMAVPYDCPSRQLVLQYPNFKTYCQRMWKQFYPELMPPACLN